MINTAAIASQARAEIAAYQAAIAPTLERAAFWKRSNEVPLNAEPLVAINSWLTFQYQLVGNKKVPLNKKGYASGDHNERNWTSLSNAIYLCRPQLKHHGVGFVFTGEGAIVGIDTDIYKLTEGTVLHDCAEYALQYQTMAMRSLGGKGVHQYVTVTAPAVLARLGSQRKGLLGAIEIYATAGFFAVTFDMLNDLPIAEGSALVTYILDMHELHVAKLPASDDALLSCNTVTFVWTDDELLGYAEFCRRDIRQRLDNANPADWSRAYRDVVSDLAKPGVCVQSDPLREAIWRIVKESKLVCNYREPRKEKAERLLYTASWWLGILTSNANLKKIVPK